MAGPPRRRRRSLLDLVTPWKTPEGRLVGFVAAIGLLALVVALAIPSLYITLRGVAIACAILVVVIPLAASALDDDGDR